MIGLTLAVSITAVLSSLLVALAAVLLATIAFDLWTSLTQRVLLTPFARLRALLVPNDQLETVSVLWLATLVAIGVVFITRPILMLALMALTFPLVSDICEAWVRRRERKIREQLLGAAYGMSNAAATGLPAMEMLRRVAAETDAPLKPFLDRILTQAEGGVPFRDAVAAAMRQVRLDEFSLFGSCVASHDQFGGEISSAWTRIAHSLTDLGRLEEKIDADSASGRMTVKFMAATPLWFGGLFYLVEPDSMSFLFNSLFGQIVLSFVLVVIFVAYTWCKRIVDIKV